ncbi:MAG TPA: ATP-binding protein, partial [Nocardioidaceae bacterium]|nr:ATP-binding protein [Nocardioidaceae bacterium]
ETNVQLRHHERMAQLGVMTAGVAHELNNPASALQRAASQLSEQVAELTSLAGRGPFPGALDLINTLEERPSKAREGVASADAEDALEDWLEAHDVPDPWDVAPDLASAGVAVDDLERLGTETPLADTVSFIAGVASIRRAAHEMAEGSRRLSEIVGVLRSYAFLDRAPVQDIDLVQGIEDTISLLGDTTSGISIVREYDASLPPITAMGAELNQVWTNLIRNACDAVATTPEPRLTLRAFLAGEAVVVEVEDNGEGVPPEIQHRVFDAFFTTKPPGQGTGLGLQVSYRVVVLEHGGDLTLESEPGRTVFKVTLPLHPDAETSAAPGAQEGSGFMDAATCEHLELVENTPKPEGGCAECLLSGDTWVHLRFCVTCGEIGCCNDSKNKHAARHAQLSGHPVMRSKEPRENFAWCFEHALGIALPAPE